MNLVRKLRATPCLSSDPEQDPGSGQQKGTTTFDLLLGGVVVQAILVLCRDRRQSAARQCMWLPSLEDEFAGLHLAAKVTKQQLYEHDHDVTKKRQHRKQLRQGLY